MQNNNSNIYKYIYGLVHNSLTLYLLDNKNASLLKDCLITAYNYHYLPINVNDIHKYDIRKPKVKNSLVNIAQDFLSTKSWSILTLKRRGWVDSLIQDYLKTPDIIDNIHYDTRTYKAYTYHINRVLWYESLPVVSTILLEPNTELYVIHNNASIKSWLAENQQDIISIPLEHLLQVSVESYNKLHKTNWISLKSKSHILARACRNYLRHQCTDYDYILKVFYGYECSTYLITYIKESINKKINLKYPNLENQIYKYQKDFVFISG